MRIAQRIARVHWVLLWSSWIKNFSFCAHNSFVRWGVQHKLFESCWLFHSIVKTIQAFIILEQVTIFKPLYNWSTDWRTFLFQKIRILPINGLIIWIQILVISRRVVVKASTILNDSTNALSGNRTLRTATVCFFSFTKVMIILDKPIWIYILEAVAIIP